MKYQKLLVSALIVAGVLAGSISLSADDKKLQKAQNTVNNIKQADPPKASNTAKPSMVGVKKSEFQPKQKGPESKKIVVPPPSTNKK